MSMGGIVFKNPYFPNANSVRLAQKVVDHWAKDHEKETTQLFGGVVLDKAVGGLNPDVVRYSARIGGRFVWTPVFISSHYHKIVQELGGIEIIDKNNKVVPPLKQIFQIIAKYDMVLALCHHSTKERLIMIDDAKEEGVERIIIVHATESLVKMSIDQMKMAANKGAYIELCCLDFRESEVQWNEWISIIQEVGADNIILATDCGNPMLPPPSVQYWLMIYKLLLSGISDANIEKMAKFNQKKLIL
jgi:hypothetical protein